MNAALGALSQGDRDAAVRFAKLATDQRPDDAEGWSMLGLALSDPSGIDALQKAVTMEPSEPRWYLHLGAGQTERGLIDDAQASYAKASELSRGHPDAMIAWANSLMTLERFGDAAQIYGRILQARQNPDLWIKAGDALTGAKDTINAAHAYERAYPDTDRPAEMSARLADIHITLGQYDKAKRFNDQVLEQRATDPDAGLRTANLLRWKGDYEGALAAQKRFWSANPDHGGLIAAMLDDKVDDVLDSATSLLGDEAANLQSRRRTAFALARFYDRKKDSDAAWAYAVQANDLYDDKLRYDAQEHVDQLTKAVELFQKLPKAGSAAKTPRLIYVAGPPRCGGSLLQTILARTEGVVSVGERGALLSWLLPGLEDTKSLSGTLAQLGQSDLAGMQRASGTADVYVDKTSPHIIVAGLLARIHRGAKFVIPKRNSRDMAVSMFFHDFPPEFAYTRAITGISDYLKFQNMAEKMWQDVGLDLIMHDHDQFISDPEKAGQALFARLGLDWSSDQLDTSGTDNVVRTFSARQVRGGVTKKFAGRGERYKDYLDRAGFDYEG